MTQVSIPQAFKQYDQGRRKVVKSEEARSCEAPKGQSLRPEGPWLGGFFGWGQLAPPHQLYGMGERCKLLQEGPGRQNRLLGVFNPTETV